MAEIFIYTDILSALIELEATGCDLYKQLSERAKDLETQKLLLFLSGQEEVHKHIYEGLRDAQPTGAEPSEEEKAYIEALLDFNLQTLTEAKSHVDNWGSALKSAKSLEMETILLLTEFKRLLNVETEKIDLLIAEERKHLKLIYDLEKKGSAVL